MLRQKAAKYAGFKVTDKCVKGSDSHLELTKETDNLQLCMVGIGAQLQNLFPAVFYLVI